VRGDTQKQKLHGRSGDTKATSGALQIPGDGGIASNAGRRAGSEGTCNTEGAFNGGVARSVNGERPANGGIANNVGCRAGSEGTCNTEGAFNGGVARSVNGEHSANGGIASNAGRRAGGESAGDGGSLPDGEVLYVEVAFHGEVWACQRVKMQMP